MGLPRSASSSKMQVSDSEKVHIPWFLFCSDRFPRGFVHEPAKECILQSRLRTRRCVGCRISSHPACRFPRSCEYPQAFGCNRTFRGWGTCRNTRRQVRRCRFRFCHTSFFSFLLLHQLIKLEFSAQQVELKWQMLNKWRRLFHSSRVKLPFVQMSASWRLVSMYRIWILQSRLILSNNQSNGTLWTSAFDYHLNYGFILLKDIQHGTGTRMCSACWNVINVDQIEIGVRGSNLFLHVGSKVCLVWWWMKYFNH